jgi:CO/xanthine dehydrogenase Mo-binding subunit
MPEVRKLRCTVPAKTEARRSSAAEVRVSQARVRDRSIRKIGVVRVRSDSGSGGDINRAGAVGPVTSRYEERVGRRVRIGDMDGDIRILDYAICEDGGTLVNPMIVDGQVIGGTAQGIGTALYEQMPFDDAGQPLGSTLADYLLPGATEVPEPRIEHMATPSPLSMFGQKGIGEGGAIGPPAAIANAVNDAMAPLGVELTELPITPRRVLAALLARAER